VREFWFNVPGYQISSIPVTTTANSTETLSLFEGSVNKAEGYGSRIRGYLCVPTTGAYTFWIASDDNSELWLSTNDNPVTKVKIASVTGWTLPRQYDKYASQKSVAITLTAGQRYYIEALHKEATGDDHISVGWQLPNGTQERPIGGNRLSPFSGGTTNTPPTVSITSPTNGQSFTAPATITINANASDNGGSVTKVEFFNGATKLGEDTSTPYSFTWSNVVSGSYALTVKATDNGGAQTTSAIVNISVTSGGTACTASGSILRELWSNVPGITVSTIPIATSASSTSKPTSFEGPLNNGDNYGARYRGYLCVPTTGAYTFWIASDDQSELWLSTNDNPANKVKIASMTGAYTNSRQWDKFPSQKSNPINLVAGQRYYIEALHKEGTGGDNLAVGWQLPNGTQERPIGGNRLSPYVNTLAKMAVGDNETSIGTDSVEVNVFPNPVQNGMVTLAVSGYESEKHQMDIEIHNSRGELLYSKTDYCDTTCPKTVINIDGDFNQGLYFVTIRINDKVYKKKLLIE